uniref:Uncharacterized protein n=1 Tax=Globodera rostochiensis TaxID=31243 RepID=A0A914HYJ5_GLORO
MSTIDQSANFPKCRCGGHFEGIRDKIGRIENSIAWLQQGQLRCENPDKYKLWFAIDPEEEQQFKEIQKLAENNKALLTKMDEYKKEQQQKMEQYQNKQHRTPTH